MTSMKTRAALAARRNMSSDEIIAQRNMTRNVDDIDLNIGITTCKGKRILTDEGIKFVEGLERGDKDEC